MRSKTKSGKKRVLIVDDHPMMRQGLAQLIESEPDLAVGGEADTARQALEAIRRSAPDLALIDISLPDKSGLELIKDLHNSHPELPLLVVSMHDEALYAERVLRAGGRGYIMKQEGGQKLLQAIRRVLGGQVYVSERISENILQQYSGRRRGAVNSPVESLTDREFEVFQHIGRGAGTREIAEHLHLGIKTVETHKGKIKQKLKLRSAADMVHYAIRWIEAHGAG